MHHCHAWTHDPCTRAHTGMCSARPQAWFVCAHEHVCTCAVCVHNCICVLVCGPVCTCVCTDVCTCMYPCMVCVHEHVCTCDVCMCDHVYWCVVCAHKCICAPVCKHDFTCVYWCGPCVHVFMRAHMTACVLVHSHVCTWLHVCAPVCVHAHTLRTGGFTRMLKSLLAAQRGGVPCPKSHSERGRARRRQEPGADISWPSLAVSFCFMFSLTAQFKYIFNTKTKQSSLQQYERNVE